MKKTKFSIIFILIIGFLTLTSCGPVLVSARLGNPLPPWFYPNRVENMRYVYFPDHLIYYDLSIRSYVYLENDVWITTAVLPTRYNHINLKRSRTIRIKNYFGDHIQNYHKDNQSAIRVGRKMSTRRNK